MGGFVATLIIIALVLIGLAILFSFIPVGLWISAIAANVKIGIFQLVGMRFRRIPPALIVNGKIKSA